MMDMTQLCVLIFTLICKDVPLQVKGQTWTGYRKIKEWPQIINSHKQVTCDEWQTPRNLQNFKLLLGGDIYLNMAIDCSLTQTHKILHSLSFTKYNASQLEVPRVNVLMFRDLADQLHPLLYNRSMLIHMVVSLKGRHTSTANSQCVECCVAGTITLHQHRLGAMTIVGTVSEQCTTRSRTNYTLSALDALKGVHLTIVAGNYPPFVVWYRDKGELKITGYCWEILQLLVEHLNFTYTTVPSIDGNWASRDEETHEWNGMIGMILRKQADMILTGFTISKARAEAVDFTFPFWTEQSAIVIKYQDHKESYFYKPLKWQVWLVTFLCLLAATVLVCLYEFLSRQLQKSPSNVDFSKNLEIIGGLMIATSLLKGTVNLMSSRAAHVLWLSFWLVSLVLVTTYTGNLVAALTAYNVQFPFNTLEELATDTEYPLMVSVGGAQMSLLQEAKSGVFAKLWQKVLSKNTIVRSMYQSLRVLMNSSQPLAIAGDITEIEQYLYSIERCDWRKIPEEFLPSGFGIGLPKGSPYEQLFSKQLMTMAQMGFFQHWKQRYLMKSPCMVEEHYGSESISLQHIWLLVLVTVGCLGVSTVILCVEILTKHLLHGIWMMYTNNTRVIQSNGSPTY